MRWFISQTKDYLRLFARDNLNQSTNWILLASLIQGLATLIISLSYSHFMTPKQFGIFVIVTGYAYVLLPIISLGLQNSIVRYFSDKSILQPLHIMKVILIWIFILNIVLLFFGIRNLNSQSYFYGFIGMTYVSALTIRELIFLIVKLANKVDEMLLTISMHSLISLLLPLILFEAFQLDLLIGFSGSNLFASMVISLFWFLKNNTQETFNLSVFKYAFRYGVKLIPHNLAITLILNSDRIVMSLTLPSDEIAIYGVALQFTFVLTFLLASLNFSQVSRVSMYTVDEHADVFKRSLKPVLWSSSIICLIYVLLMSVLSSMILPDIYDNQTFHLIFAILACSVIVQSIYLQCVNFLQRTEFAVSIWKVTFSVAVISLAMTLLATLTFGTIGTAISFLFTQLLLVLLFLILIRRKYFI